jgi:hypothetical protein
MNPHVACQRVKYSRQVLPKSQVDQTRGNSGPFLCTLSLCPPPSSPSPPLSLSLSSLSHAHAHVDLHHDATHSKSGRGAATSTPRNIITRRSATKQSRPSMATASVHRMKDDANDAAIAFRRPPPRPLGAPRSCPTPVHGLPTTSLLPLITPPAATHQC